MTDLIGAFGVCFVLRGIFMLIGRGIPQTVMARLQEKEKLRGWCRGTGAVHILWGICAVLIWAANVWPEYSFYSIGLGIFCAVGSIVISLRTTRKYTNKI